MKKLLFTCLLLVWGWGAFCQYDQRPSRSRFYNSKFSTFSISAGDLLVYEVQKDSSTYNYVVTVKKFGNGIEFDYSIPQKDTGGTVTIQPDAVDKAVKYDTLNSGKNNLTDASILWLSKRNFSELEEDKGTSMIMGGNLQKFERRSTGTMKINYKGKEKIITIYNLESTGTKVIKLAILNVESNPLIIKMEAGDTITLKEVR